jgi:uncharacterized protein with HEPN domain
MNDTRDSDMLRHILRYCKDANDAIERCGDSLEALQSDSLFRNSVALCAMQIGELTTHLSESFKERYNHIPWRDIRGMRNIIAHRYGTIDIQMLHETIHKDIPYLSKFCEDTLTINTIC